MRRRPLDRAACTCCRPRSTGAPTRSPCGWTARPPRRRAIGAPARAGAAAAPPCAARRRRPPRRGGCCRRSTSSSAATPATRRREPVLRRAGLRAHRSATSGGASARSSTSALALMGDDDLEVLGYARFAAQLEAGFGAHHAGTGAAVQGGGGGLLRRGARQGRVRHRDAGRRDQHAGPRRRDREAHQVHRRPPRDADAGGVHAADRPGRPAGSTTPGGAIVLWSPFVPFHQVAALASSRSFRLHVGVPADLQHGRQPGALVHATRRPTTSSTCRSPSTRPNREVVTPVRPGWSAAGPPRRPAGRRREPVRRHPRVPSALVAGERRRPATARGDRGRA